MYEYFFHLICNNCIINKINRIMRITTAFLILCTFSISAEIGHTQTTAFSLNLSNTTILDALENVEQNSDFVFIFSEEIASKLSHKINISTKSEEITDILNELLTPLGLHYKINGRQISIVEKPEGNQESSIKITGRVLDLQGEPLIGVTVQEVGTNNVVVTDLDGNYSIYNISSPSSVLRFSYVGFVPQEVKVGRQTVISIKMESDVTGLEEVVVVGYSSQKRESVIGAISTVKPENLEVNQTSSLTNALAGKVAGIIAVQRSGGEPGYDKSDFWIRGINTFGANSKPLVLIDGIERSLNNISPEEIASFSVLKDATATAVYGVRGANGVILIETKKGKIGKPTITIKADYGISQPTQLPEFVDAPKYMETLNYARQLSGLDIAYLPDIIEKTRNGVDPDIYPNVNWFDALLKNSAPTSRVSADINGGTERLRYSFVLAYMGESGILKTDPNVEYDAAINRSKYNLRSNVDINLTPSTTVNISIGGYIVNRKAPGTGISTIFSYMMNTPPNVHPAMYSNGQIPQLSGRNNPYSLATQTGYLKKYESNIESLASVTQDIGKLWSPLEGLQAKVSFSFDSYSWNQVNRTKTPTTYYQNGRDAEGNLLTYVVTQGQEFLGYSKSAGGNRAMYFEGKLNYNRTFGPHSVDGLFLINLRDYFNADAGDAITSLPYRNAGIAGRAAYSYMDKYFAEFNFGYNGSENFQRGYRFGFFPSGAIGWMVSNEPFMENIINIISKLKIRGSWGLVGNDQIGGRRFAYLSTIISGISYGFGYNNATSYGGRAEGDFGIPNLTWETAEKKDIGIELGLFDAINLSADVFWEKRRDIFMQRKTIPELAGYNKNPYANFGKVDNKGVELTLEVNKQINKDWQISAMGNFTFAQNKYVEYDESESIKQTTRARTGHPINQYFGLTAERLFTDADFDENGNLLPGIPVPKFGKVQPGDIKYVDINQDNVIDPFDESAIGMPSIPEIVYGFGINTKYKNIDFGIFFQGTGRVSNMLSGDYLIPGSGGGGVGNVYSNVDDRWTPENQSSEVFWPRLSISKSENNMRSSTWWQKDASFLRLKNIEVGYTLPKKWQRACMMRHARIFFRGSNLLTFAKFDMWDPEINSSDGMTYPLQKVYSFGLEVSF